MQVGQTIEIKALSGASRRTKNRIRERGSQGFVVSQPPQPVIFSNSRGVDWVLLDSKDSDWSGWLPVDEIEVINESR